MAFPLDKPDRPAAAAPDAAQWAARACAGDREAFERLVALYKPLVMGFFFGRVANPSDAEDLAQEVWLAAHQRLGQLRRPDRFGPWLMVAARRRLIDFYRSRAARPEIAYRNPAEPRESEDAAAAPNPAARAADSQLRAATLAAIEAMPERYRIVLYLRLIHEDSSAEIARRLGAKESAVRMRLQRGLARLREELARRGFSGPGA
jgi:RNA polymerase sigma-70 factor (ECF subfamily)